MEFLAALSSANFAKAIALVDQQLTAGNGSSNKNAPASMMARLYMNRAFCNYRLQLYRKAAKDYDHALQLQPGNMEALLYKGLVLEALKRPEEAKAAWRAALSHASLAAEAQLIMEACSALARNGGSIQEVAFAMPVEAISQPSAASAVYSTPAAPAPSVAAPAAAPAAPAAAPAAAAAAGHATGVGAAAKGGAPKRQQVPEAQETVEEVSSTAASTVKAKHQTVSQRHQDTRSCNTSNKGAAPPASAAKVMHDNPLAIQIAVTQINSGKVTEAEQLLDRVLEGSPKELGALVARGTARALRRDLTGAVQDFSGAIEVEPRYADTWKRRGQARSALGETDTALTDLQRSESLLPLWLRGKDLELSRAECCVEKSLVHQKRRDYYSACKELQVAVRLDPNNQLAWNMLGLCSTSQGNISDGVAAYEKAVALNPELKEAWFNMGQALKESGQVEGAERAFARLLALDSPDAPSLSALRILAQMRQQQGQHKQAIALVKKAMAHNKNELIVELLFLRAICHHALGEFEEATEFYQKCLTYTGASGKGNSPTRAAGRGVSEEALAFQALSFYQKELALYLYHNLDRPTSSFCMDKEILPLFKELWCKKAPPTPELLMQYTLQAPITFSSSSPLPSHKESAAIFKLLEQADQLGILLQYTHQGFLENVRQRRAAGLAAIELAQTMQDVIAARKSGSQYWVSSVGSSLPEKGGSPGRHAFGWRDAMDILVKWRQLAEPNDQVVWVDLLTRREFEQGFGSHTPMFSGQTKCVRYFMNFRRALELHKKVLLKEGHAMNARNLPVPCGAPQQQSAVKAAKSASDMYQVLQQDSWVVVPIASVSRPSHTMEGTRLTLVKVPKQPDGFEFSIRTPVTPPRWTDFDQELEAAWENILMEMTKDPLDCPALARAILVYAYYWYNFMPLARGTAACGYTTILSLFWAAGMPITARIPKDYQVDWEAILAQHPQQFIDAVSPWMLPELAKETAGATSGCAAATTSLSNPPATNHKDSNKVPPGSSTADVKVDGNGDVATGAGKHNQDGVPSTPQQQRGRGFQATDHAQRAQQGGCGSQDANHAQHAQQQGHGAQHVDHAQHTQQRGGCAMHGESSGEPCSQPSAQGEGACSSGMDHRTPGDGGAPRSACLGSNGKGDCGGGEKGFFRGATGDGASGGTAPCSLLPRVEQHMGTVRQRLFALNSP